MDYMIYQRHPSAAPLNINHLLSPNIRNNSFNFDTEPFQSAPNSPWNMMSPLTSSMTDVFQAFQAFTLMTAYQQNAAFPFRPMEPLQHRTKMPEVSRKVFVGGLPTNIEKSLVEKVFGKFGAVIVDWPRSSNPDEKANAHSNGYVFLIYEQMESVQRLISNCQITDNRFFYSFGFGSAQVRPWYIRDCVYTKNPDVTLDIRNTVFLGGVPRPATSEQLAKLLSVFGEVLFASIDVDPEVYYPKGAGRVVFANSKSFIKAIKKRFIKMDMLECHKKEIEMKPYVVENQLCDQCENQISHLFCIDQQCLQYYCGKCFDHLHQEPHKSNHRVVIREGERTMDIQGTYNAHLGRFLDYYIGDMDKNSINCTRMPPKNKCVLKTINNTEKLVLEKAVGPKKKKMVKEQEDKTSGCETILENWSEILEKALTAKHQKTIIKTLASNADNAIENLSINDLRRALWTPSFIAVPEGQKFCTRALPKIGIKASYYLIKKAIIEEKSTKQTWDSYGELIGTAWKYYNKEDENVCQEIEDEIMKGLFHDAIMLADALSEKFMHALIAFKGATCSFKAKMDNMLYESARVVLWRGCEAPNNRVRYRACKILMEFFPWRPSALDELERATQNQHSNFIKMLKDQCSEIRKETAYKVLKICAQYWSYIPSYGKRQYLAIICDELILDADPSVRLSVIEGMTYMVMESICLNAAESALKCVCPVAIYDKNERVRLETFKLLRKLIPNRFLKYWSIVPIDKIMGCLEAETSESVKKEIVQLVFTSFFQKDENANETLKRLNYLSKYGRNAALTFYRLILPLKLISVEDAGAHLKDIALAVYKFASGNFSDDSKVFDDTIGSLAGPMGEISLNEQHPKWSRVKLFMDCTVVLYMMLLRDPKFDENRALKVKLEKVMTKVFKKMFQCFRETSALGTTMTLGSMLPQQTLTKENLISQVLQHLNEETDNAIIMPYLEATMQWDAEPILQTISEGIHVITNDVNMCSPSSKKNKTGSEVAPAKKVAKALYFLSYIISSLTAKAVLLNYHILELQTFYKNMRPINKLIEERLTQNNSVQNHELYLNDDILLEIKPERQAEDCLVYIKDLCDDAQWFEEHILSLSNTSEPNIHNHEFFYKLSNVVLRKMCDVLMAWDFAGNIVQPEVNHNVHDTSTSMRDAAENNFIESFKRIGYAFMKETTPSDCMPPVFNSARQLLILNPEEPNLSIATIMYAPTWVIERVDNGDELEDKQIGEQLFQLLKAVSDTPDFFPKTYTHQLAQTLIDAMTWIIQDSADCPDPREHNYEIPRFIEVLLFESIRRHSTLFKIFLATLKERVMRQDLFTGAEQQYSGTSKHMINLWVLGACAQLTHICFLNPDVLQTRKKETENIENDATATEILVWLKKRIEKLETDDIAGTIDDLLATQIKSMLSS